VGGSTLTLKYKGGEKAMIVPSDAAVVNLVVGNKADRKSGAKIFTPRWPTSATVASQVPSAFFAQDNRLLAQCVRFGLSSAAACRRTDDFSKRRIQGARIE
jgi:hypothetical protein